MALLVGWTNEKAPSPTRRTELGEGLPRRQTEPLDMKKARRWNGRATAGIPMPLALACHVCSSTATESPYFPSSESAVRDHFVMTTILVAVIGN